MKVSTSYPKVSFGKSCLNSFSTLNQKIARFMKNVVFIWPTVIFYNTPLIFKNIRQLSYAKTLMNPQIHNISVISQNILGKSDVGLTLLKKLGGALGCVADIVKDKDSLELFESLNVNHEKLARICSFFSEALIKSPSEEYEGEKMCVFQKCFFNKMLFFNKCFFFQKWFFFFF